MGQARGLTWDSFLVLVQVYFTNLKNASVQDTREVYLI